MDAKLSEGLLWSHLSVNNGASGTPVVSASSPKKTAWTL